MRATARRTVGWGVGFPALRLGGLYLALTTFALAVAVPQILKYKWLEGLTGGDAAHNARMTLDVLSGQKGAPRDAVLANAAAALVVEPLS